MTSPYVDSKATGTYHGFLLDGFTLRMKEKIYIDLFKAFHHEQTS